MIGRVLIAERSLVARWGVGSMSLGVRMGISGRGGGERGGES